MQRFAESDRFEELQSENIVEEGWSRINASFVSSAETIPGVKAVPRRAWISDETLKLIKELVAVRAAGDYALERLLHKSVKRAVKYDKGR